ncbi:C10 family peptidase [Polaribacter sp. MSW13]|uniref:C10 family peptidase n=1 Tax=Polaribacter marinus TaxID=2916838 RepID=A0A9X1VPG8_9FLAO|nr:C10 family peptidase [Polaribacter marinus]MCI2229818.1 C10 family peptidase [Polaribacter marinus]
MKKDTLKLKLIKKTTLIILLFVSTISFTQTVEPFLTDVWGGVNCVDDNGQTIYPTNYYTPYHSSPGCVAISMSQVLHFYKWPIKGIGSNVYSENYNGSLVRHAAFFDDTYYKWDEMLDEYMNVASTESQQKAVGELMYHVGVALQMNYEPTGSTSNINKTPFLYHNFFRFSGHYEDVTWSSFWDRLYENIQQGRPVPVAVDASRTGDGHVFVVDGYKEINGLPYYHLNWGWYDDNGINGWYNIQGWTSTSGGYNTITGAVFDVLPNPQITSITNIDANSFKVKWEVSEKLQWEEFTLEQKVDAGAWEEVASGITTKEYTINNPTGQMYQFRVKSKVNGSYYANSWSEIEKHTTTGGYNGYVSFGGSQYAYARQTPDFDLDFTTDYTLETWLRLKEGNVDGNILLDIENVFGLEITDVNTENFAIKYTSHASGEEIVSNKNGNTILLNQWTHIAVSHTGNKTKLFINGILMDSYEGANFNLVSSTNALNIAEKYHGSYSSRIKADFDQLRISKTDRYPSNFTPSQENHFTVDAETIAYFTFQDVHNVRFKDEAANISVIVLNDTANAAWSYELNTGTLSTEDLVKIQNSITLFPNPVVNNNLSISFHQEVTAENIQFKMFDLAGRQIPIQYKEKAQNSWNLDVKNTKGGLYLLQITIDNINVTRKILIQ